MEDQDFISAENTNAPAKPSLHKGFTLIEMAFVLVIVGILVALGAQLL
ncbi:MAG: type II secretion system protein, partial [Desulfomonilia bacterium]